MNIVRTSARYFLILVCIFSLNTHSVRAERSLMSKLIFDVPEKILVPGLALTGCVWLANNYRAQGILATRSISSRLCSGADTLVAWGMHNPYKATASSLVGVYALSKALSGAVTYGPRGFSGAKNWVTTRPVAGLACLLGRKDVNALKTQVVFAQDLLKELLFWAKECNYCQAEKRLRAILSWEEQCQAEELTQQARYVCLDRISKLEPAGIMSMLAQQGTRKFWLDLDKDPEYALLAFDRSADIVSRVRAMGLFNETKDGQVSLVALLTQLVQPRVNTTGKLSTAADKRLTEIALQESNFNELVDVAIAFHADRQ
jgi:hypothetical protein